MGNTTTTITMAEIDEKFIVRWGRSVNDVLGLIETWYAEEDKFLRQSKVLDAVKALRAQGAEDPAILEHRLNMLRVEIHRWSDLDPMPVVTMLRYVRENGAEKFQLFAEKIDHANMADVWLSDIKGIVQELSSKAA